MCGSDKAGKRRTSVRLRRETESPVPAPGPAASTASRSPRARCRSDPTPGRGSIETNTAQGAVGGPGGVLSRDVAHISLPNGGDALSVRSGKRGHDGCARVGGVPKPKPQTATGVCDPKPRPRTRPNSASRIMLSALASSTFRRGERPTRLRPGARLPNRTPPSSHGQGGWRERGSSRSLPTPLAAQERAPAAPDAPAAAAAGSPWPAACSPWPAACSAARGAVLVSPAVPPPVPPLVPPLVPPAARVPCRGCAAATTAPCTASRTATSTSPFASSR